MFSRISYLEGREEGRQDVRQAGQDMVPMRNMNGSQFRREKETVCACSRANECEIWAQLVSQGQRC